MSYYPLSQVKTNLYTNGNELSLNPNFPLEPYIGYYWKNSKNQFFTGKTPQDLPSERLYLISEIDLDPSIYINNSLNNSVLIVNFPTIDEGNEITINNNTNYVISKQADISPKTILPYYSPTFPTSEDYKIGEYRRYFCKKTNEVIYIEINEDLYGKLLNKDSTILYQLYQPFDLPWKLTGIKEQVYKVNKNMAELISQRLTLPMFLEYLKNDFTKYYK